MAAPLHIPTVSGTPCYTLRTRLDGREYTLRFAWNQRHERWSMDIMNAAGEMLLAGQKLVTNQPMLRFYHHDRRLPPGEMVVSCTETNDAPPGLFDLEIGKRCTLTYFPKTNL